MTIEFTEREVQILLGALRAVNIPGELAEEVVELKKKLSLPETKTE